MRDFSLRKKQSIKRETVQCIQNDIQTAQHHTKQKSHEIVVGMV